MTSSHTIAGGACTGLGIGPGAIGRVIGVFKAYCTRVGAGPLPSELLDERGEQLRRQGGEFGTVTGRPRRCGWFDAVAARYAVALNGLTSAIVTKLDVLTGFETSRDRDGLSRWRPQRRLCAAGEPDLQTDVEELPGWSESIAELPAHRRSAGGRARVPRRASKRSSTCRSRWSRWDASARSWLAEPARRELSYAYGSIRLSVAALARRAPSKRRRECSSPFSASKRRATSVRESWIAWPPRCVPAGARCTSAR